MLTVLVGFAVLPVAAQNPVSAAPVPTAPGRPASSAVTLKFDTAYTGDTPFTASQGMKKGGSVSKRADGCCIKGKTKGKML